MVGLINAEGVDPKDQRLVLLSRSFEGIVQVLGSSMCRAIKESFLWIV